MWFGSCNDLLRSAFLDLDNYHLFPNNEEGRRIVQKISDSFCDSFIWLGDNGFYVALSAIARDRLLAKIKEKWIRKKDRLRVLQAECKELQEIVEMMGE